MKIIKKIVIITLFIQLSTNQMSAKEAFHWLHSTTGEKSALSGECEYLNDSLEMKCNLRQIRVSKISIKEKEIRYKQATDEINKELKKQSVEDYTKKLFGEICSKLSESKKNTNSTYIEMMAQFENTCHSPSKEKLLNLMLSMVEIEANTCRIMESDTGDFIFKPVNSNKWVNTSGPTGVCGAVLLLTLEREPDHSVLWKYTQKKSYTNTETEFCKKLETASTDMAFSWNASTPFKLECKYIRFGLW